MLLSVIFIYELNVIEHVLNISNLPECKGYSCSRLLIQNPQTSAVTWVQNSMRSPLLYVETDMEGICSVFQPFRSHILRNV